MLVTIRDLAKMGDNIAHGGSRINNFTYLTFLYKILSIPIEERTDKDMKNLKEASLFVLFFSNIEKSKLTYEMNCHEKLLASLHLEKIPRHTTMFKRGELANKFYVCLYGGAIVLGNRDEILIRKDKQTLKQIMDCCKSKTVDQPKIKEWLAKATTIPQETRQNIDCIEGVNDGIIQYKDLYIRSLFGGVNPYEVDKKAEILEPKTGLIVQQMVAFKPKGSYFGQHGIQEGYLRSATQVSTEESIFAVIDGSAYKEVLSEVEKIRMDKKKKFFEEKVFKGTNIQCRDKVVADFSKNKMKKGLHLFKQNDIPKMLYVIQKGEVKLFADYFIDKTKVVQDGPQMMKTLKKKQRVDQAILYHAGEIVGDLELFDYDKRICSAVCSSDVVYFQIPMDNIRKYCKETTQLKSLEEWFRKRIGDRLSSRLSHLEDFKNVIKKQEVIDNENNRDSNDIDSIIKKRVKEAKDMYTDQQEILRREWEAGGAGMREQLIDNYHTFDTNNLCDNIGDFNNNNFFMTSDGGKNAQIQSGQKVSTNKVGKPRGSTIRGNNIILEDEQLPQPKGSDSLSPSKFFL